MVVVRRKQSVFDGLGRRYSETVSWTRTLGVKNLGVKFSLMGQWIS